MGRLTIQAWARSRKPIVTSLVRRACGAEIPRWRIPGLPVHDVIGLLQNGETIDTVKVNCFPQPTRSQIYERLACYENHRGEIDLQVARQMAAASE